MNPIAEDILMHYGVKRRSGRYPWGSGDNPFQRSGDFLSRVEELQKQGLSEKDICENLNMKTTDYRLQVRRAKHERKELQADRVRSLREDGKSYTEIAKIMGFNNESSVRALLNENTAANRTRADATADILEKELEKKEAIDIGSGAELELGCSKGTLNEALFILQTRGYEKSGISVPQPNNEKHRTTVAVIHKPEITQADMYKDPQIIKPVGEYHSVDGGISWDKREYPSSVKSDRISIRYGDEGGSDKDGVIEIRRGVADLDLGKSHYAQVRILVDGTHYLKGMAMYSDDIPEGHDIVFNTNKKKGTPMIDGKKGVLKPINDDPDNPFGAYIKADGQSYYNDPKGKYTDPLTGKKQSLSAINKLKEEGEWDKYSRNLSSQFLSKQPIELINKQLKLTYSDHVAEFDEIMSYNNPTIKKKMLLDFANSCDSAAVHLKAAALPRQESRVILPITQLKDNEVYAPYLRNGEKVALIRYPHGGTFEIPELTVNNKNPYAKNILGNAVDAIGINSKVAERLSGADFDGDTVVVIPTNNKVRIKSTHRPEALADFDPKTAYPYKEGMRVMTEAQKGIEMGVISNLITDMTLRGAPEGDIVRAVKHSMVVIDAPKHQLNYKQSEKDNGIAELKKKWQKKYDAEGNVVGSGGASTIISRHKQTVDIPETKGSPIIDRETGRLYYKESGRTYINKNGELVKATSKRPLLLETEDLRTLSSGNPVENAYADYGNKVKALANQARKEYVSIKAPARNPSATETYSKEVESLRAKLMIASKDQPKQRQALAIANSVIKAKLQAYPELSDKANKKELAKVKRLAMDDARHAVGASSKESKIVITDKEWEAIQANAISSTQLTQILRYTDSDAIKQRALPKTTTTLSPAKVSKLNNMKASGYTIAEMAASLGVSTSTVSKYLNS